MLVGFDHFIDDLSHVGSKGLIYKDCEVLVRINKQSPLILSSSETLNVGHDKICDQVSDAVLVGFDTFIDDVSRVGNHYFTPNETLSDKDSGGGRWLIMDKYLQVETRDGAVWGDDDISNEMKSMLIKVGWIKDFIEKNTPVLPISGWMGENLLKKSGNMAWWKGKKVFVDAEEFHVDTDVGDVRARRVEQGIVKPAVCVGAEEFHVDIDVLSSDQGRR